MIPRAVRRILAFATAGAAVLAACSDSNGTLPTGVAGAYVLTSANGQPLPYTLPGTPAGTTVVLVSGSLVLLENGRFDEVLNYSLTSPAVPAGQPSRAETLGDASVSGSQITFKPRFEDAWSGTVSASTITYSKVANSSVTVSFGFTKGG